MAPSRENEVGTHMTQRIDLVLPWASVDSLDIPDLAITNGDPAPEWADVAQGRWAVRRQPSLRLPLDPRSARNLRRQARMAPWSLLLSLAPIAGWAVMTFGHLPRPWNLIVGAAPLPLLVWSIIQATGLPQHLPYRTRSGELRIPGVPIEVAREWIARNPAVTATDEPPPRPHSRRFYIAWTVALMSASIGLGTVIAADNRDDGPWWMLVPALFAIGLVTAVKIVPPAKPTISWPT
jgi:hypothetical protein